MGMFSSKGEREPAGPAGGLSVIATGVTVRGDIDSNHTVKVEGTVDGNIQASQQVLVAKEGLVQGDVDAREAIIGGTVQGSIHASERVEIQPGATVTGDITTRKIAVAEGGSINGVIRMGDPAPDRPFHGRPGLPSTEDRKATTSSPPIPSGLPG